MNITERMQLIVDELYRGNKAGFAKAIGLAPTSISNYLSKSRASKPSSDILESIANNLPQINSEWLITGKGEMFKQSSGAQVSNIGSGNVAAGGNISHVNTNNARVEELEKLLLEKEAEIKSLKNTIKMLFDSLKT